MARALADAIDTLAGSTYSEFFRARGQVTSPTASPIPSATMTLAAGCRNTAPTLSLTNSRIVTSVSPLRCALRPAHSGYSYVLDFGLWDRLSLLGAEDNRLVMSALQPNLDFSEVDFRWHGTTTPPRYSNHRPRAQCRRSTES